MKKPSAFRIAFGLLLFHAWFGCLWASLPGASPSAISTASPSVSDTASGALEPKAKAGILALVRKGLFDSALALCRRALEADGSDAFAAFMAAKLSPSGRESSEFFSKAQRLSPDSPEAEESLFRLGQYHYAAGKYHLAIPCFRDYLRLFPLGDWIDPAHYWMGNACLAFVQARPEKADYLDTGAVYLQRMLDGIKSDNYYRSLALEGIAKIKAAKGDREGARASALSALEIAPEDEKASILLLAAQMRPGSEGKEYLRTLLSRYPQSPEVGYLRRLNAGKDPSQWRPGAGPSGNNAAASGAAPVERATSARTPEARPPALPAPVQPPVPVSPPAAVDAPPGGFTLQLGAFSQMANAQSLAAELRKLGLEPEISESMRAGKPFFQVRMGRFSTSEEARAFGVATLKPRGVLFQAMSLGK